MGKTNNGDTRHMVSFTAYANKKFEVLARHGCVIAREAAREAVQGVCGAETAEGPLFFAQKKYDAHRSVRVAYKREGGIARVITLYPVKTTDE